MKIKETIGIDVSKLTIDVTVHSNQAYCKFENKEKDFKKMMKWVFKQSAFDTENVLFVFEHTGLYSHKLAVFLTNESISFSMVPGLEIKRSLGIVRGKDDRVDSRDIARYGYRLRDEIKLYKLPSKELKFLKTLLALRETKVKQRSGDKALLKEYKLVYKRKENETVFKILEKSIKSLTKYITEIELEMDKIIKSDEELKNQYVLITSIKGIGPQIALYTLVFTEGFTKFKTPRQFASYCGVAPFPNSSGTSIRGKTKVSNLANKKIKSLLDLGAKGSIQYNLEMKTFYERRLELGKSKMSTINIIRNKLIARMFAVVKRNSPYVDFMKYAS
jgi:transposase